MAQYGIRLAWDAGEDEHGYRWSLDDGTRMEAIAPDGGGGGHMDPEQALAASIASCHLLCFVTEAARLGFTVTRYEDEPIALLARDDRSGELLVGRVVLTPKVTFGGQLIPDRPTILRLHEQVRRKSIIGNSVRTRIDLEPRFG